MFVRAYISFARRAPRLPIRRRHATGSPMHNNDPEVIERERRRGFETNLLHEHAPGWNESLATESEAYVKAEKHQGKPSTDITIEYLKKRDHSAETTHATSNSSVNTKRSLYNTTATSFKPTSQITDNDQVKSHTEAEYERDEVKGPLGRHGSNGNMKDSPSKLGESKEAQSESPNKSSGASTPSEDTLKAGRGEAKTIGEWPGLTL